MALASGGQIAVIIPARDAARTLPECLQGLGREGVPGPDIQLVVVDDGSTDETAAIAAVFEAEVLSTGGRGRAAARNVGARHTETEFLVFLDADTVPQPGWLRALLAPFGDPAVAGVKGRYMTSQRGVVPRFAQLEFEEKYARLRRARYIEFVDTGTAAYRREVFWSVGGFDEEFPAQSSEDVELAFRLAERGARFAFADGARVRHLHTGGLVPFLAKKVFHGYSRAAVYRRYPSKVGGDSYTPAWTAPQIATAGLLPVLGTAALARGDLWPLAVTALGAFLATGWPLLRWAWKCDRSLVPWVLPLAYLRAAAQGIGLAAGLAALFARRLRP